jgi:DNA-binding NarL/FixJ family response regulator
MTKQDEERDALVRVLVVDDQQLVRDGIASLLRVQEGIAVVEQLRTARKRWNRRLRYAPM